MTDAIRAMLICELFAKSELEHGLIAIESALFAFSNQAYQSTALRYSFIFQCYTVHGLG
jgi:hypothetical protein